jgi:polyisoprenoid-binding protein YceI
MYDAAMRWQSLLRSALAAAFLCGCGASATEALLSDQLPPKREAPDEAERYELTGGTTKVEVDISGVVSYTLTFPDITGELLFSADEPERSLANVLINMKAATTKNKELERIAKSEDFLDVEKYPTATFDVRSLAKGEDANSYDMVAVLALHGVEKAVTVPFTLAVDSCQALGTTSFSIDRRKFGIESDTFLDGMAGDDIDIRVRIEIARDKAPASCGKQKAQ